MRCGMKGTTQRLNSWRVTHMGSFDYIGHRIMWMAFHRTMPKMCVLLGRADFPAFGKLSTTCSSHGLSDRKVMPKCGSAHLRALMCVCVYVSARDAHPDEPIAASVPYAKCVNIDITVVADPKHTRSPSLSHHTRLSCGTYTIVWVHLLCFSCYFKAANWNVFAFIKWDFAIEGTVSCFV